MGIKKITKGLILSLLMSSGVAAAADFSMGMDAYQSGDYKTALSEWIPLAEQGHAFAQYSLGHLYEFGTGTPQNYKALAWPCSARISHSA